MTRPRYYPHDIRQGPAPEAVPDLSPSFTLERQIAEARKRMGEKRWAELNAEWK